MTPHDLLANFVLLAEAPNGIQRLRELVLELAVRGKLVEQDSRDEPAAELLGRIKAEKARLVMEGKIRSGRALPSPPEACPFDIPSGWEPCRLAELGFFLGGKTPSTNVSAYWNGSIPWVSPKDMKVALIEDTEDHVSQLAIENGLPLIPKGSVLIVVRSGILRRMVPVAITVRDCTINQDLKALWPYPSVDPKYVALLIKGFESYILEHLTKTGTTVESLKFDEFATHRFPLPPLGEQARILARVDELMALLDRLDAWRQECEAARTAARDSTLAALGEAPTPGDVEAAWLRVQDRFHDLFAIPEDVESLRQTILQLAIRGRLVAQDPTDPSGASLLEEVEALRAKMAHIGKRRKALTNQDAGERITPFQTPASWTWARLGDILSECRNGLSTTPNDAGEGIKLLRISAATSDPTWVVNTDDHRWVLASDDQVDQYQIRPGDLLSCRFNGNLRFVGKVAQVPPIGEELILYPDKLIRLRPILVDPGFLCLAVNSVPCRAQIEAFAATTAGNLGINGAQLQSILVPIPPLPEQIRIRETAQAMFIVCDRLVAQLRKLYGLQGAFSAAAVHHLEA